MLRQKRAQHGHQCLGLFFGHKMAEEKNDSAFHVDPKMLGQRIAGIRDGELAADAHERRFECPGLVQLPHLCGRLRHGAVPAYPARDPVFLKQPARVTGDGPLTNMVLYRLHRIQDEAHESDLATLL